MLVSIYIYIYRWIISLWFCFHCKNLKEKDQSLCTTFVSTSWFSWVRSLVSRKCATQLITISRKKAPVQDLKGGLLVGMGMLVDLVLGTILVDATQDQGHWERWPSDAVESHVWMFWEAMHYRCTPNVTHTLIRKKWWKRLTLIEKFCLFICIWFLLSRYPWCVGFDRSTFQPIKIRLDGGSGWCI